MRLSNMDLVITVSSESSGRRHVAIHAQNIPSILNPVFHSGLRSLKRSSCCMTSLRPLAALSAHDARLIDTMNAQQYLQSSFGRRFSSIQASADSEPAQGALEWDSRSCVARIDHPSTLLSHTRYSILFNSYFPRHVWRSLNRNLCEPADDMM